MDQVISLQRHVKDLEGLAIHTAVLERPGSKEFFVCGPADLELVAGWIQGQDKQVLEAYVFGQQGLARLPNCPVCELISPIPAPGGTCIRAIKGPEVRRMQAQGRPIGTYWEDQYGRYLFLAGVLPQDQTASPADQARSVFEQMDHAVHQVGMAFTDVVRTWFYNQQITSWYDEFNRVRNDFFRQVKVFDGLVPASTGIGIKNVSQAAVVGGLFAVKAKQGAIKARPVQSPMQGPALDYGSSFSRAVELTWPDHRRLLVSGTASIDLYGRTCHIGDPAGQIRLTMQVLESLLAANGYGWADVVRAVGYLKDDGIRPLLQRYLVDTPGCKDMPIIVTPADVCREDLLFEMECEAIRLTAV